MKSKIFLIFYLLISNASFAQYGYHHYFPLMGKIKSYETFQIIENDSKEKQILVEKLTYDNNNRVLTKSTNELLYKTPRQEKNIYKKNLVITYECKCNDINEFINNFAIKDKSELKNKKSSGYGSGQEPTKFVTYNYSDKKGNITLTEKFGESGYKTLTIKTLYNFANKVSNKKVFDFDDNQTDDYTYEYDKRGNLIKETSKDIKYSVYYTHLYKYDNIDFQNEMMTYGNDELISHDTYIKVVSKNKEEIYKMDNLKNLKSLYKETFYNSKNIVIQTKEYSNYDTIIKSKEKKYTENGILSNINYVDHLSASNLKFEQVFDSKKNWIELIVYISFPNQKERKERRIKYIRNIEYIK
ncbi:hypothetical protein [Flavobacterium sp. CLA17]|uniref:hypothetical protein n=1 Tax=Flavobacterium sp. CLA17 TaxID=2724135 RepID=UPI0014927333|nr:hypothetical protein [Flavobacterium sp. CLA17]QSB25388.1 hypothetical protein HAV12_013500 [Flavobacterium sp. CLA17]